MVNDNEIKATVSPFAIREGEIKTFDGKDGYVSMNQIVHKINIGHINDIHFEIIDLVNEFEFITSRQLFQLLEWKGIDVKSQDKLNNKLDQLVRSKILTRYYFNSEDGSHRGLNHLGIVCFDGVGSGINGLDSEPVGKADYGAQIAGVTDGIESDAQALEGVFGE